MTNPPFTPGEIDCLTQLAAMMIPASDEFAVPGADDPAILAEILSTAARSAGFFKAGLAELDATARNAGASGFAALGLAAKQDALGVSQGKRGAFVRAFVGLVAQVYYRDDRVMRSLAMEPRPPFPEGFPIEQGDWSLLDPVRARGRRYRQAP